MPVTYWAEHAWLDGAVWSGVAIQTDAGRVTGVRTGVDQPPADAEVLRGFTVPGLANAHSHAFHRALRGTVQTSSTSTAPRPAGPIASGARTGDVRAPDSFWTWREVMYRVAGNLTPDSYFALARATYAEMALAGITCVGEFHYLHHAPGGQRYKDPNAMGEALLAAAAEAGIRITLLDTCYLSSGFGAAPEQAQLRFSDGTAEAWASRWDGLASATRASGGTHASGTHAKVGAAIHSVRAVPARELGTVAAWARERQAPLHLHLSEQPAENEACLAAHGRTPTQLLHEQGVLGPGTTAVHATHLTEGDIGLLGAAATGVCMCPTTERDLADGIGPAYALQQAGSPLSLGSDSHAVIDLLEEARAMELDERLRTRARGHWSAAELLRTATERGHSSLGWPEAGRLVAGGLADFTTIALDTVRTAGPAPQLAAETAVFAATGADVRHTVVGGRHVVRDGAHTLVPDVPAALAQAIQAVH